MQKIWQQCNNQPLLLTLNISQSNPKIDNTTSDSQKFNNEHRCTACLCHGAIAGTKMAVSTMDPLNGSHTSNCVSWQFNAIFKDQDTAINQKLCKLKFNNKITWYRRRRKIYWSPTHCRDGVRRGKCHLISSRIATGYGHSKIFFDKTQQ